MCKILSLNLLVVALMLTGCSDHVGTTVVDTLGPEAPINEPDTGVFAPTEPVGGGSTQPGTAGGSAGTAAGEPGSGNEEPTGGGGTQGGSSGSGETGEGTIPGSEPGGGGSGGQPVPEPGTLLLVGSGLAGIGASLLRRRRRREELHHP